MILVDIEFVEVMMLQGATHTLEIDPRPIWIGEISTSEHQPAGVTMNPNFAHTFDISFERGCHAFITAKMMQEMMGKMVADIVAVKHVLVIHNFLFR